MVDHTYDQDGNKCVCGQAEPINYGSEAAPLSVTQALALAEKQCLSNSDYTEQIVVATGIVTNQPTDSGSYLKDITLRDVNDEGKTIHINTLNINDGVDKPDQNDIITIKGYIRKLNDVIEFGSKSSTHVYTVKNQRGQSSIEEGAHDGASISGLTEQPKVTNGTEIEFTVEPLDGKKVTDVKVNGTSILSSLHETNKYSFTVHGNATITVETADASVETPTWVQATSANELKVGYQLILAYVPKDGDTYISTTQTTLSSSHIAAGKYSIPAANTFTDEDLKKAGLTIYPLVLEEGSSASNFKISLGGKYLGQKYKNTGKADTAFTLETDGSDAMKASMDDYYWTISIDAQGIATITNVNSSRIIALNTIDFRPYTTSTSQAANKPKIYYLPSAE